MTDKPPPPPQPRRSALDVLRPFAHPDALAMLAIAAKMRPAAPKQPPVAEAEDGG